MLTEYAKEYCKIGASRHAARADDRIITCAAVTGEYDLILEVAVKDVADLTDLTLDTLLKLPTVRDVVTCLSLRSYKTAGDVGTGV